MFGTNDRETSVGLGEITSVIFGKQASSDVAEFAPNTLIQHFEGCTGQIGHAHKKSLIKAPTAALDRASGGITSMRCLITFMMFICGIGKMAVSNIVMIFSLQRVECRKTRGHYTHR